MANTMVHGNMAYAYLPDHFQNVPQGALSGVATGAKNNVYGVNNALNTGPDDGGLAFSFVAHHTPASAFNSGHIAMANPHSPSRSSPDPTPNQHNNNNQKANGNGGQHGDSNIDHDLFPGDTNPSNKSKL